MNVNEIEQSIVEMTPKRTLSFEDTFKVYPERPVTFGMVADTVSQRPERAVKK